MEAGGGRPAPPTVWQVRGLAEHEVPLVGLSQNSAAFRVESASLVQSADSRWIEDGNNPKGV